MAKDGRKPKKPTGKGGKGKSKTARQVEAQPEPEEPADEYSANAIWAEPIAEGANRKPQVEVSMIEYVGTALSDEEKLKWLAENDAVYNLWVAGWRRGYPDWNPRSNPSRTVHQ